MKDDADVEDAAYDIRPSLAPAEDILVCGYVFLLTFTMLRSMYIDSCKFLAHLSMKCSWWAIVVSQCPSSMRHVVLTIALKAYSSYTPGPVDSILGRKHQGDL